MTAGSSRKFTAYSEASGRFGGLCPGARARQCADGRTGLGDLLDLDTGDQARTKISSKVPLAYSTPTTDLARLCTVRGRDQVPVLDLDDAPIGQLDREGLKGVARLEMSNLVQSYLRSHG
jgi:hypothetical protein